MRRSLNMLPLYGFERFWAAYPRRQARKDARRAWDRLRPTPEVQDAILSALTWQRDAWADLTYAPLPATYLRGERWTDEPLPTPQVADSRLPAWAREALHGRKQG